MNQSVQDNTLYVNAEGHVLGRLASIVAKKLLSGYRVYVVNVEKAVLSGEKHRVIEGYKLLFKVRTHANPERSGIRRPRSPIRIFKRAVRGMLPMDKPHGRDALKRLRVYVGVPSELKDKQFIVFPEAMSTRLKGEYITLEDLARAMGWKGVNR